MSRGNRFPLPLKESGTMYLICDAQKLSGADDPLTRSPIGSFTLVGAAVIKVHTTHACLTLRVANTRILFHHSNCEAMNSQSQLLCLLYAYPLSLWITLFLSSLIQQRRQWTHPGTKQRFQVSWKAIWIFQGTLALCFVASAALSVPPYALAISEHRNAGVAESYVV